MEIGKIVNQFIQLQSTNGAAPGAKAKSSVNPSDNIDFSKLAQSLKSPADVDGDEARARKVDALQNLVSQGSYAPDLNAVAGKLLGQ